jgi:type IV secretory pathway VirB2 component (pilin)
MYAPVLALRGIALWGDNPSPSPGGSGSRFTVDPSKGADAVPQLQAIVGYVCWIATAIAIFALFAVALKWAFNTRNGEQENLRAIGYWIAGCVILASSGQLVNGVFGFNLFDPHPQAVPGLEAVQTWLNRAAWVSGVLCGLGLLLVGMRAFRSHRNGEPLGESLLTALAALLFVSAASGVTYAMLPW